MSQQKERIEATVCIADQMLSDADLLAAIDGEADEVVLQHLHSCPCCAARAELLSRLTTQLRHRLLRALCPSTLALIDYHLRLLEPAQHARIAAHLAECPHCASDLVNIVAVSEPVYRYVPTP
jgi:anti-sigma factor RsiW